MKDIVHWIVGPQIVGFIFVLAGFIQKRFPPKRINDLYGYRSETAKKSQPIWDEAQIYSANLVIKCGVIAIAIGFLLSATVPLKYEVVMAVTTIFAGIGIAVILMVKTEKHLERMFDNKTE